MGARMVLSKSAGAIGIIVAIVMIVLLSCGALAIDMSLALITKNQLYNLADGAALAGTRVLGKKYAAMPAYTGYTLSAQDIQDITDAVTQVAANNIAGGKSPITINGGDIRIGRWDSSTRTLTVTNTEATAVEVTARRDTTANGPISAFFANVMGISALSVTSVSERQGGMWTGQENPTAALTGVGYVPRDGLEIPVGISKQWFINKAAFCSQPIKFSPTNDPDGCAGWNTFDNSSHSASTLGSVIDGCTTTCNSPEAQVGTTSFNFTGGQVANAFDNFNALFNVKRLTDGDGNDNTWTALVVVYDYPGCGNPTGFIPIVGFATTTITDVCAPPGVPCKPTTVYPDGTTPKNGDKVIIAKVDCDLVDPNTRGGGASYGTLGEIPGLVK